MNYVVHKSLGRTLDKTKCGLVPYPLANQSGSAFSTVVRPWNGLVKITCPECNKYRPFETKAQTKANDDYILALPKSEREIGYADGYKAGLDVGEYKAMFKANAAWRDMRDRVKDIDELANELQTTLTLIFEKSQLD